MTYHRDIHKIHAYIFMQQLSAYLLVLRYFEFLSKTKGNLTSKTDSNGNTIAYTYDSLNRLTKKTYPDATQETYMYNLQGN